MQLVYQKLNKTFHRGLKMASQKYQLSKMVSKYIATYLQTQIFSLPSDLTHFYTGSLSLYMETKHTTKLTLANKLKTFLATILSDKTEENSSYTPLPLSFTSAL